MSVLMGPIDPIRLLFNVLNGLMARKLISYDDVRKILRDSLDPNMPDLEKEKYLDSIIVKKDNVSAS